MNRISRLIPTLIFSFLLFPMGSWLKFVYTQSQLPNVERERMVEIQLSEADDAIGKRVQFVLVKSDGNPKNHHDVISRGYFTINSNGNGSKKAYLHRPPGENMNISNNLLIEDFETAELYLVLDMSDESNENEKRILSGKKVLLTGDSLIQVANHELENADRYPTIRLSIDGLTNAIGKRAVYRVLKYKGSTTNWRHILDSGSFTVNSNGRAYVDIKPDGGAYSISYQDIDPIDFYMILDMNDDYYSDSRANANDRILEGKTFLVKGDSSITLKESDLDIHKLGMTWAQFHMMTNLAQAHNQGSTNGLVKYVKRAMNSVVLNPSLISVRSNRTAFIVQDAKDTAGALCTVIHRFLYLQGVELLYPNTLTNFSYDFTDYYLDSVSRGWVVVNKDRFCFTYAGYDMINRYVNKHTSEWKLWRNGNFSNNQQAIDKLYERGSQIVMVRLGENTNYAKHTCLAVLVADESRYRMIDAGYLRWNGAYLEDRFLSETNEEYIFHISGYVETEK